MIIEDSMSTWEPRNIEDFDEDERAHMKDSNDFIEKL